MDVFKLLTKSTKLKLHGGEKESVHLLPSDGPSGHLAINSANGKKRKRSSVEPDDNYNYDLNIGLTRRPARHGNSGRSEASAPALTQRAGFEIDGVLPALSEDKCRSILTSHKIKIVDLTKYRKSTAEDRSSAANVESKDVQVNHKAHKAACQLVPQPLISFQMLRTVYGVGRALMCNIVEQGYVTPTEVQLASIPLLLRPKTNINGKGNDPELISHLLTVAPTGSGKTLAFLIPLIQQLTHHHHKQATLAMGQRHVNAVIVAPTKELVNQIVNEGRKLAQGTGLRITAMRKAMILSDNSESKFSEGKERTESEDHASGDTQHHHTVVKSDILVTTPLLLVNAIGSTGKSQVSALSSITSLTLDEADVLLDPLFRDQTLQLWSACTNPLLQVSFWSATIGSNIEEIVLSVLRKRELELHLTVNTQLLRCVVGLKDSAVSTISHKLIYAATEPGKLLGLRQLVHPPPAVGGRRITPPLRPPFLVFTQTIERATALYSELLYDISSEAGGSSRMAVLHSDLSDSKRSEVMTRFRKGQIWVLITTDLLSRGVDFRGINGVVNYDIPTTSAAYVHRVGRTGRAGREGGVAVTFYTKDDIKYVKGIANVIAASEKGREKAREDDVGLQTWLLGALPDVTKKEKQKLKRRGVEVRRSIKGNEDEATVKAKRKAKISTKSGYERRLENNRKGAVQGSRRRQQESDTDDDEWGGIGD